MAENDKNVAIGRMTREANDETRSAASRILTLRRLLRKSKFSVRSTALAKRLVKQFLSDQAQKPEVRKASLSLLETIYEAKDKGNSAETPIVIPAPAPAGRPTFYGFCEHDIHGDMLRTVNERIAEKADALNLDCSHRDYLRWVRSTGKIVLEQLLQGLRDAEPEKARALIMYGQPVNLDLSEPSLPPRRIHAVSDVEGTNPDADLTPHDCSANHNS